MATTVTREASAELQKKLTELTKDGRLEWRRARGLVLPGSGHVASVLGFEAEYEGVPLVVAEFSAREYDGHHDEFFWVEKELMAVRDLDGAILEVLPSSEHLKPLINTVHAKVVRVPSLVERMLEAKAG